MAGHDVVYYGSNKVDTDSPWVCEGCHRGIDSAIIINGTGLCHWHGMCYTLLHGGVFIGQEPQTAYDIDC